MTNPARAERLWLALAVATFWTVRGGWQAEGTPLRPDVTRCPARHMARRRASRQGPGRFPPLFSAWPPGARGRTLYGPSAASGARGVRTLASELPCSRRAL